MHDVNWLATNVPLMQDDMAAGTWVANDDLLAEVISHLDSPNTFYHGHHTLIHLSRDQLRASDCETEDTGAIRLHNVVAKASSYPKKLKFRPRLGFLCEEAKGCRNFFCFFVSRG